MSGDISAVKDLFTKPLSCSSGIVLNAIVYASGVDTVDNASASSSGTKNFLGFVVSKPTTTTCVVQIAGELDSLTGLTPNVTYYLSDTPGHISTTPGTNTVTVGTSIDTTTLLMLPGGVGLGASSGGGGSGPFVVGTGAVNSAILNLGGNVASGKLAVAEGGHNTVSGVYSHVEGYHVFVFGSNSHGEGGHNTMSSTYSHVEGRGNSVYSNYSHAEGLNNVANGKAAHAEGALTQALAKYSHAEGTSTYASGNYSHAEGTRTESSGKAAHSEGNFAIASGNYSHAEGGLTYATAQYAHAGGSNSKADKWGQFARGPGRFGATSGSAQHSILTMFGTTSSATPKALFLDNSSALCTIATNQTWAFTVTVTALQTQISGGNAAKFIRSGVLQNAGGTVALVGTVQTIGTDIGSNAGAPPPDGQFQ